MGRATHSWWIRLAAVTLLVASLGVWAAQSATAAPAGHLSAARPLVPLDATPSVTADASATATTPPTVAATPSVSADSTTPPPTLSATAAELYDATSGKTLLTLSPDTSLPMASTTKIMTAVVALTYGHLDQRITVGADTVAIENGGTSVAGLRLGETLSLQNLLYCLMLPSGDDAAIAIADGVAGSQSSFVAMMNLEAGFLGLSHTHYENPHGLDAPGHFTSVSDLVKLTAYAMKSPTFAKIVATPSMTIPATATHHEFTLVNTNELLPGEPFAYDGAIGVKTGFTGPAGYCLVFVAQRPSGLLIGAVLGEPTYDGRFTDARSLLDWAYTQLSPAPTPTATASATPSATAAATTTATP